MLFSRCAIFVAVFVLAVLWGQAGVAWGGESNPIRIAIIGDSTVCNYDPAKTVIHGWGQMLAEYVKHPQVEIVNLAMSGRSSKSFLTEGRWEKVVKLSPAPNYVLIQFGHNDDVSKGPERGTLNGEVPATLPKEGLGSKPIDWYRNNLRTYIEDARRIGAVPVLVTPMERCQFRKGLPAGKNRVWAEAAIAVAQSMDVPVIDLNRYSFDIYSRLGAEGSESLHYRKADGTLDGTHYGEVGARVWAEFIAEQLAQKIPALAPAITLPAQKTIDVKFPAKAAATSQPATQPA